VSDAVTRRNFMRQSQAAAGALALGEMVSTGASGKARQVAPEGTIPIALASVTFTGLWYPGRPLTVEEVIDRAKEYGYDGVELNGKRPHSYPPDMPKRRCQQIRQYAADKGVKIYSVSGNNDFSSPVHEHRESQLVLLRELMRVSSDLGAKIMRVFLAATGVTQAAAQGGGSYERAIQVWAFEHEGYSDEQIWDLCRQGMVESARYAREFGVTLALANHPPVIKNYRDVLRMVREVDSPNLKVSLEAPLMHVADEASIRKAAFEVGRLQTMSRFGGDYARGPDGEISAPASGNQPSSEIYKYYVRAMLDIGDRSPIGFESCHLSESLEFKEKSSRMAAEFMRGVIQKAQQMPRQAKA
jgi:sugar phosphate isomerase/epimerase